MSKQIAAQIKPSEIIVKVRRTRIMKKMEARSVADLVRMAEALGVKPAALQHRAGPRFRNLSIVLIRQFRRIMRKAAPHIGGATSVVCPRTKVSRVDEVPIISIVDDNASVRTATARLLSSLGFSAHAFASAQEFLSSPRLCETSCLIADVEMPGMSGVELQEYLIAHHHETPMIFITAFPEDRIRERVMRAGAIDFLSKPFDEPRLLECVERALTKHKGRPNDT